MMQVGRVNSVRLSEEKVTAVLHNTRREAEKLQQTGGGSFLQLFRHRAMALRTLNLCFNWLVISGSYYGLALSASSLGGNPYYSYAAAAVVEIPAYIFNLLGMSQFSFTETIDVGVFSVLPI